MINPALLSESDGFSSISWKSILEARLACSRHLHTKLFSHFAIKKGLLFASFLALETLAKIAPENERGKRTRKSGILTFNRVFSRAQLPDRVRSTHPAPKAIAGGPIR